MAAVIIGPDDLAGFCPGVAPERLVAMIGDAAATAALYAPCLETPEELTPTQLAQAKAILRGAITRWATARAGVIAQQSLGPFSESIDTRTTVYGRFFPVEQAQLKAICRGGFTADSAFAIDTAPGWWFGSTHPAADPDRSGWVL